MKELKDAITKGMGKDVDDDEVEKMIKTLDDDNNDLLNFHEFLAATVTINRAEVTEERRDALFKCFDIGG